jgi:hypothetical protein
MTDRPFSPDAELYDQRQPGYRLGGYDQRIADLQEFHAPIAGTANELDPVPVERHQQVLDHLQADLLEAQDARAAYLENLDAYFEQLQSERTRQVADLEAIPDQGAPDIETAARASGVVRSPRTPDSLHRAHQAQAAAATFRPHP